MRLMTVRAEELRALTGSTLRVRLTAAAGGGELEGRLSHTLESADGMVAFLTDPGGGVHNIHYQHIESATATH